MRRPGHIFWSIILGIQHPGTFQKKNHQILDSCWIGSCTELYHYVYDGSLHEHSLYVRISYSNNTHSLYHIYTKQIMGIHCC